MLAQNFKSAADLGITEPQFDALRKTLVLLETGKLRHVSMGSSICALQHRKQFCGQFNMNQWAAWNDCGTVACIGGTAELVGNLEPHSFDHPMHKHPQLLHLFYPETPMSAWSGITPAQAATALRSYLTIGDARWDLAVAS